MNTYANAAELAWNGMHKNETRVESPGESLAVTRGEWTKFFREKVIPEVKRAAIEINTTQTGLHAQCALFPNEAFPYSVELILTGSWLRRENYLSFRVEPDGFNGMGLSWYTSDNPICKKIDTPRVETVEELIVRFVGSMFNRHEFIAKAG